VRQTKCSAEGEKAADVEEIFPFLLQSPFVMVKVVIGWNYVGSFLGNISSFLPPWQPMSASFESRSIPLTPSPVIATIAMRLKSANNAGCAEDDTVKHTHSYNTVGQILRWDCVYVRSAQGTLAPDSSRPQNYRRIHVGCKWQVLSRRFQIPRIPAAEQ
jgi:hypothetical protein